MLGPQIDRKEFGCEMKGWVSQNWRYCGGGEEEKEGEEGEGEEEGRGEEGRRRLSLWR